MTDLDRASSSIRDDSICESSLPPNKSSGDIGELRSCPFCGCATPSLNPPVKGIVGFTGSINCPGCMASMPREIDDAELIRSWNTRTPDPEAATLISELQAELEQKNTPLTKQELPGAERSGCETAIEIVARIIDPERWAVLDGYLAETKRKYRGQNVGYDLDAFKDRASMAKAIAILACPDVARAFGRQR